MSTRVVDIRELENRLIEYLPLVRRGDRVLIVECSVVIAELRQPGLEAAEVPYPALLEHAKRGSARLGAPNQPILYPEMEPALPEGESARLLDLQRGER